MQHVGEGLLDKLDDALTEALRRVRDGDATKATVTLAFSIAVNDEGEEEKTYTLKAGRATKDEWYPSSGNPRLPFEARNGAAGVVDAIAAAGGGSIETSEGRVDIPAADAKSMAAAG